MKRITLFFLIYIQLISCINKSASKITIGQIHSIKSLNEISLGENDTVFVVFGGGYNDCSTPDHLEVIQKDFLITIKAYSKQPTKPEICLDNVPSQTLSYIFKPISKGTYTFKAFDSEIISTTKVK